MIHKLTLIAMADVGNVGGVNLPGKIKANDAELTLNGAGIRKKLMMKLYAGGLYLQGKDQDDQAVVANDAPMGLRLHIMSNLITNSKMQEACNEGFKNAMNGDLAPLKKEIDQFNSYFAEKIEENDVFDLIYVPGDGVNVFKNEECKGSIPSFEFKKALFGIWLGDKPADKNLKSAMLGK